MTDYELIGRPTKGAGSDGKYLDFAFDTIPSGICRLVGGRCLYEDEEKNALGKGVIKPYTLRHYTDIGKKCSDSGTGLNSLQ